MSMMGSVISVLCTQMMSSPILEDTMRLQPVDLSAEDSFGASVSVGGSLIVVGSARDDDEGLDAGAAYLFDSRTGQQLQKLTAFDADRLDRFGTSVDTDGQFVVIGSFFDDDNGPASGSAYLFDTTGLRPVRKLTPSDGSENSRFGAAVAVDGAYAVVGAFWDDEGGSDAGAAYVFSSSVALQLSKLTAPSAAAGDWFGRTLDVSHNRVVVGAPQIGSGGSGLAYVFDASSGQHVSTLRASDGAAGDFFGNAVAMNGDLVVVGAPRASPVAEASGAVYVFDAISGVELCKLIPSTAAEFDQFGASVDIGDDFIVIGSSNDNDNVENGGSVFVFDTQTRQELARLFPRDASPFDFFGLSVSYNDGVVVGGAPFDDNAGDESGSAYVFQFEPCSVADLAFPFGTIDLADLDTFITAFLSGASTADIAPPFGVLDLQDVDTLIVEFISACP